MRNALDAYVNLFGFLLYYEKPFAGAVLLQYI